MTDRRQDPRPTRVFQRVARAIVTTLSIALLSLALAELCLQAASLWVSERAGTWRKEARHRILCVGDSHTWGVGVSREESYPGQLQRLLDEREPGAYSVLNLGIPGMNTAQVRTHLPIWLSRYEPDVVVVWAGINNYWNVTDAETETASWSRRLDGILIRSRLYRLVRVRLHDRELERYGTEDDAHRGYEIVETPEVGSDEQVWTFTHDGVRERIRHKYGPDKVEKDGAIKSWNTPTNQDLVDAEAAAGNDDAAIYEFVRAARSALVFVTYPLDEHPRFAAINRAMRSVAKAHDIPLVDSQAAVARIPRDRQEWLWASHPSGPMYEEIARDLVPILVRIAQPSS